MSPPVSESPILAAEVSGPLAPTPMGSPAPVLTTLAYRKNQTLSTPAHVPVTAEPAGSQKGLVLNSPMLGVAAAVYPWPLKKGKGSMRRSEDKQDEGAEIVDTIRWVCVDHPCIEDAMQDSDYYTKYDSKSFENMTAICNRYNKAVEEYHRKLTESQGTAKVNNHFNSSSKISNHLSRRGSNSSSGSSSSSSASSSSEVRNGDHNHMYSDDQMNGQELTRVSRPLLKHILTKCYNKSVTDPNELNHYEAFTPEVYGETSFELICQILDKLTPISSDNKFVDLGSGVGQVVLQVAALTTCSFSLGIEKANTPAKYAKEMETNFKYWMSFYGKIYSPFKLVHGDFLDAVHQPGILASTIVFVNNFAFGPEVDQHLKDIFADLNDGARIFSSKSFCALNFRITERNLSDIGTIMHVSKMDPLKGSVSWTGKPVSYYLHVIDRAKLERYFQRNAASRKTDKDEEGGGRRGRKRRERDGTTPALLRDDNGIDSSDSRDVSRASSLERDENSNPSGLRRAISDSNDGSGAPNHRRPAPKRLAQVQRRGGLPLEDLDSMDSSSSMLPPAPAGTPVSGLSTQPASEGEGDDSMSGSAGAHRPLRSTVANAAAITEALAGKKKKGRPRKVPLDLAEYAEKNDKLANSISGLDLLHDTTLRCIQESNENDDAPLGCVNERLSEIAPQGVIEHEELPQTLRLMPDGSKIPHQLQLFLETMKNQYLTFMQTMQEEAFKTKVQGQIQDEQKRQGELHKREKQLKAQIDNLISDSLGLLQCRLQELGIKAKTPPEFIEKAKGIVCSHHDLQKSKASLEAEVRALEASQEKLLLTKERELLEKLAQERPDLSSTSAKEVVRRELEAQSRHRETNNSHESPTKVAPLLNKLSDVTFTKCGGEQVSAQIRKRPQKQRDWPEKRSKLSAVASPPPASPTAWVPTSSSIVAKIEEKSPEMLARKIIDEGRTLEKQAHQRPSSAATLTISPTKSNRSFHRDTFPPHHSVGAANRPQNPPGMVEVRKIEPISPSYPTMGTAVDLPKIDLAASMAASSASHHHHHHHHSHPHPASHSAHAENLLLPPHPDSRSRSSEHTLDGGDVSFAKSKMSTTPRAEQFEDRLKTIIHSVLSSDQQGGPPPAMTITSTAPSYPPNGVSGAHGSGGAPRQAPMFSPVKRELPSHLPPPPNTRHPPSAQVSQPQGLTSASHHHPHHQHQHHPGGPTRSLQYPSYHPGASPRVSEKHVQGPQMPRHHHLPPMKRPPSREYHGGQPPPPPTSSSSRTMNDLISSEIDRSLHSAPPPPPPSSTPSSLPNSRRGSYASHTPSPGAPPESASNLSRTMSQVIEDSIRGHLSGSRRVGGELEGLALPRTKSPEPSPSSSSSCSQGGPPRAHYPTTTTTTASSSSLTGFDPGRGGAVATSAASSSSSGSLGGTIRNGGNDYPAMEGLAARFNTYMAAENKRMMDPRGRYMSSMEHQQHGHERPSSSGRSMTVSSSPMSSSSLGLDRKRLRSPPVLPPKKQHLDDNPDYRLPKDDNKQQWQDEISTGFDRLVAYATEVDRRRKSTDSNSPSHQASSSSSPKYNNNLHSNSHAPLLSHLSAAPSSSSSSLTTLSSSTNHPAGFDSRMSTLSMKFKGSYRRCPVTPPPPNGIERGSTPRVPTPGSSSSRAATPSSTSGHATAHLSRGKSPLPGENLPEHHPKKRYFAETRDSTSASSSASSTYGGTGLAPLGNTKPRLLNTIKGEPYSVGSYERHARHGGPTPPTPGSGGSSQTFYETTSGDPTRNRPTMR